MFLETPSLIIRKPFFIFTSGPTEEHRASQSNWKRISDCQSAAFEVSVYQYILSECWSWAWLPFPANFLARTLKASEAVGPQLTAKHAPSVISYTFSKTERSQAMCVGQIFSRFRCSVNSTKRMDDWSDQVPVIFLWVWRFCSALNVTTALHDTRSYRWVTWCLPDHKWVPTSSRCHTAATGALCLEEDSWSSAKEKRVRVNWMWIMNHHQSHGPCKGM